MFCRKVFLEISQSSQEKTCARASFLIKLQVQVFSCEFYEDHLLLQNTSAGCFKMNEWIESWTTSWLNVQKAILTNKYEKKKEDPLSFSGNQRNKAITMAVLWLPVLVFSGK